MKILVTGGAGYIGSTTCAALEERGYTPVILDSFITGRREFTTGRIVYEGDIADRVLVERIFREHPEITVAIHFAALIQVPESVAKPYDYYQNNVAQSLQLFKNLHEAGCRNIVFSSSASVYDDVPGFMVTEQAPLNPRSPYARTKYMMEMVLKDLCAAYGLRGIALRYFNPVGADSKLRSGLSLARPSHLLGKLVRVARGEEAVFQITGVNWPTRDGSGIRDYLHVWDLAQAHVQAVEYFDAVFDQGVSQPNDPDLGYTVINLGSGRGVTVKEFVQAFETVFGRVIPKVEAPPRPGDVAGSYANADRAKALLRWEAKLPIEQAVADALRWEAVKQQVLKG